MMSLSRHDILLCLVDLTAAAATVFCTYFFALRFCNWWLLLFMTVVSPFQVIVWSGWSSFSSCCSHLLGRSAGPWCLQKQREGGGLLDSFTSNKCKYEMKKIWTESVSGIWEWWKCLLESEEVSDDGKENQSGPHYYFKGRRLMHYVSG